MLTLELLGAGKTVVDVAAHLSVGQRKRSRRRGKMTGLCVHDATASTAR